MTTPTPTATYHDLDRCFDVQVRLVQACERRQYSDRKPLSPDLPDRLTVGAIRGVLFPEHLDAMETLLGELEPETDTEEQA
jgi:hypothetical protein